METDATFLRWFWLLHHLLQDLCNYLDLLVMKLNCFGKLCELFDKFAGCCHQPS